MPTPQLTFAQFTQNGLLEAIAETFNTHRATERLLVGLGYPPARIPEWVAGSEPIDNWQSVARHIANGIIPGRLEALLAEAARLYRGNPLFAPYARRAGGDSPLPGTPEICDAEESVCGEEAIRDEDATDAEAPPQPVLAQDRHLRQQSVGSYIHLQTTGRQIQLDLRDTLEQIARRLGFSAAGFELAFFTTDREVYRVDGVVIDDAVQIARELTSQTRDTDNPLTASVANRTFQDYLLSRLYVVGPDQRHWELQDIPASTTAAEVARGVIAAGYDPKIFGVDNQGKPRPTVVELQNEDESTRRLIGQETLHDQDVTDGSVLTLNPESRAAAVDPNLRETSLQRVKGEVQRFVKSHPGFHAEMRPQGRPTEYTLRFCVPSFAPPAAAGGPPVPIEEHEVLLALPGDFPILAPEALWQPPVIFHPNVEPKTGKVCLGPLEESYRPSLDLGYVCQMLLDIAAYRNYTVESVFNGDARAWAISVEGQIAIEERGGFCVTRLYLEDQQPQNMPAFQIRELR